MRAYQNALLDLSQVVVCLIDHEPKCFSAWKAHPGIAC